MFLHTQSPTRQVQQIGNLKGGDFLFHFIMAFLAGPRLKRTIAPNLDYAIIRSLTASANGFLSGK
jgi:hypothetical protein